MAIYKINTNGAFSINDKTNEFYKMIFGGIFFYLTMFFATKYTIHNEEYFIFLIIFLTFLYVYIFIFIPISLILKINKVVKEIQINQSQILLVTNKQYQYLKENLSFKEVKNRFTGFSIKNKSGILLKTKEGKEFWLIEDFYNDFEELKQSLTEL